MLTIMLDFPSIEIVNQNAINSAENLECFNMLECRARNLPAEPGHHHIGAQIKRNKKRRCITELSLLSRWLSFMYLMVRPNISFPIGRFSLFHEYQEPNHLQAVNKILSYLRGTQNHCIRFSPETDGLKSFTDSDCAGDVTSHRSTTGFLFLLHGGPVGWSSHRKSCWVSLSSQPSRGSWPHVKPH